MAFQNILPCIDTNSMNITSVRFVSREILPQFKLSERG